MSRQPDLNSKWTRGPKWESNNIGQRTLRKISILRAIEVLTRDSEGIAPTVSELSKATNIPRSSVYRHLQTLAEDDLVDIGSGGRKTGVRITRVGKRFEYGAGENQVGGGMR
jgi:RIO-like serine/threonine protein kinase